VNSSSYRHPKSAKSIRRPPARLATGGAGKTPLPVLEAILRAEIGEAGVVRNLRDRPSPELLAKLKCSTGHFAADAQAEFPGRLKWCRVCGPELSPAKMTDYIETEEAPTKFVSPHRAGARRRQRGRRAVGLAAPCAGGPSDTARSANTGVSAPM